MVPPQDAPYPDGDSADIVVNHDQTFGDVDAVSSSIVIIENIASLVTGGELHDAAIGNNIIDPVPHDDDDDDDGDAVLQAAVVVADDEASAASHLLSLSSATSATSIASTLSDGISRPRNHHHHHPHHHQNLRPRSVSLNLPPTFTTNSTPRSNNGTPIIRSTSNSSRRPRSNPRTRTPMRHASPLLVTGRALQFDVGAADTESTTTADRHPDREMITILSDGGSNIHIEEVHDENVVVNAPGSQHDNSTAASNARTISPLIQSSNRHRIGIIGQADIIPEEGDNEVGVVVAVEVGENHNVQSINVANIVVVGDEDPLPAAAPSTNHHRPASLRHGTAHWLAQPASSTVHGGTTRRSSNNPTRRRHNHHQPTTDASTTRTLSNKQHPSHRKLRRWNNDRFVGTASEHLHHTMMGGDHDDSNTTDGTSSLGYDQYWRQHYMPNYPCKYRSEFAKLVMDDTKKGQGVRDRFLKGEVGVGMMAATTTTTTKTTMMTEEIMHRMIAEKFQKKLGVTLSKLSSTTVPIVDAVDVEKGAVVIAAKTSSIGNVHACMGAKIFRNLSPRIQTILSRICATIHESEPIDGTTTTDPFFSMARYLVASFESYLVSLALVGLKKDVSPTVGYPPLQSQQTYELFDKVLSSPPKIVMKSNTRQNNYGALLSSSCRYKMHAVLVPTVHFYFATDDDDQDGKSKRGSKSGTFRNGGGGGGSDGMKKCNSAFHRILLYAVCQFHGLESTSTVIQPTCKSQCGQRHGEIGGVPTKVVTVQGGWLLAPSIKVLDACMAVDAC